MDNSRDIYFDRPDNDTWVMARLHCSLRHQIQDSPLWQPEEIPDIPLTEEQMLSFVRGYAPDFDCRYAPFLLGGWFYITRSGYWLKKFRYKKRKDGFYHVTDTFTTEKEKGRNLLKEVIAEGYFRPRIFDDRLRELFRSIYASQERSELLKGCRYYQGEETCPERWEETEYERCWFYEKCWVGKELSGDSILQMYLQQYDRHGMSDFSVDDGVPKSLKALLFDRYYHGGYMSEGGEGFRRWYKNNYLRSDDE